jgi:hypothetical protein
MNSTNSSTVKTGEMSMSIELDFEEPTAAPVFISNAQAVTTADGITTICFYEPALSPVMSAEQQSLIASGKVKVRAKCVARVVIPSARIEALIEVLGKQVQARKIE